MKSVLFRSETLALAALACGACSPSFAIDKTHWPRVAPVLFVHGVGSAPIMWGVMSDKENIASDQPLWPAADNSKSGEYFWYKSEADSLDSCRNSPYGDIQAFSNIDASGMEATPLRQCGYVPLAYEDKNPAWSNSLYTSGGWFTAQANSPLLVGTYDYLRSWKYEPRSRSWGTQFPGWGAARTPTWDIGLPASSATGHPYHDGLPATTAYAVRKNGIETFDAFWGNGWPDGMVPNELVGTGGMLYGTYLTSIDHKWVKAKYARFLQRYYVNGGGDDWDTFTPEDWSLINKTARPDAALETRLVGSAYVGHCTWSVRTETSGDRTLIRHTYNSAYNGAILGYIIYITENKIGYTGRQLPEETKYGEIGQLYITVKKVLDKYYVDGSGIPNWYLGNGESDPDAKIVLMGHSQGGVVSRGVCYPGFGTTDQYDAGQGFLPMYWPKELVNQSYTNFDGSAANMSGCWFDVRKHLSGVITTSSPHYGSPIGYMLDGVYATHKAFLDKKLNSNSGFYNSIWGSSLFSLDNQTLDVAAQNAQSVINDINPVGQKASSAEGFTQAFLDQLRTTNASNPRWGSYRMATPFAPEQEITSIEEGRLFWQKDIDPYSPAPSSPCEPVDYQSGAYRANHYRMYWQPEYDNWVRSFRSNENNNGGLANEKANTVSTTSDFSDFGKTLCEEQVGRWTRLSDNANPSLATTTGRFVKPQDNPFDPAWALTPPANGRPKIAAPAKTEEANLNADVAEFKACIDGLLSPYTNVVAGIVTLFVAPVANPYAWYAALVGYPKGKECIKNFKMNVNMTVQSNFHDLATNAAEGLAFHPASLFLHRLNQKGGPDKFQERRPFPVRPDGSPIPFICIVNNVSSNSYTDLAAGASVNGDWTVNTLSQDLGFGYPDVAKSGSLVKMSFTGFTHTMAGTMPDSIMGPFWTSNTASANVLDRTRNIAEHQKDRQTVANLILGLAIGQSPVFPSQGAGNATLSEIEGNYTQSDHSLANNDGFILQRNDREAVLGKYTRLKGLNPDEVYTPVALPYSSDRSTYLVDRTIVIGSGEEMYIPAGSKVVFTVSGSLVVASGGRLTFGGVPAFSSSQTATYGIQLISQTDADPNLLIRSGARLKYPDQGAGLLKSWFTLNRNGLSAAFRWAGGRIGTPVSFPPNHLYAMYDSKPNSEWIASQDQSLRSAINFPGVNAAVGLLLQ